MSRISASHIGVDQVELASGMGRFSLNKTAIRKLASNRAARAKLKEAAKMLCDYANDNARIEGAVYKFWVYEREADGDAKGRARIYTSNPKAMIDDMHYSTLLRAMANVKVPSSYSGTDSNA